jgi:hypothetical protein
MCAWKPNGVAATAGCQPAVGGKRGVARKWPKSRTGSAGTRLAQCLFMQRLLEQRPLERRHGAPRVTRPQRAVAGGWASSSLILETRGAVVVEYVAALALAITIAAAILFAHGSLQMPRDEQCREALSHPYP